MAVTIQVRRDTAANWVSANPVLHQGEPGLETDTGKFKLGDGSTAWTSLEYALSSLYEPFFNVKAYGAACNGTTDDTTAVAAAYSAAGGAGTVMFPTGTVTCIRGGINPAGAATWGPGATVRFLAGITPSNAMFTASAACSFYGLTFDLNSASTTNPATLTDGAAVYAYNASGWSDPVRLTQCKIINGWQCGLIFGTLASATSALSLPTSPYIVDGCEITGNGQIGVYAYDTADGVVTNSYIHSNGASGIEEVTGLRNRFSGNTCVSNGVHGIVSEYSYGATITGNTCTDNGISGVVIGGGSTTISPARNFTITGNTCRNNGHTSPGHGVDIDTTVSGLSTTPQPAYGTVTGNTCDSNVDHGIYVNNSQYVAVTGNTSTGNGDYGIELTCENATVAGNICTGNLGGIVIGNGGGHMIGLNYVAGNTSYGYADAGSIASTYAAGGVQTPGGTLYFLRADGNWASPSATALQDPLQFGQALVYVNGSYPAIQSIQAANFGWYHRLLAGGYSIGHVDLQVSVSSGNISAAAYQTSGTGASAVPGTQYQTTGAVPCPATGYAAVALGASCSPNLSDWLALSADNTTATFNAFNGYTSTLVAGLSYAQATAHPLPTTPSSLTASNSHLFMLRGS